MMKNKSVNMNEDFEKKINQSRERLRSQRGRIPTFTDWMLEAAAEKLARESKQARA